LYNFNADEKEKRRISIATKRSGAKGEPAKSLRSHECDGRSMSLAFVEFADAVGKSPDTVCHHEGEVSLSFSLTPERGPISAWELDLSESFISGTYSKAKPRITIAPGHA